MALIGETKGFDFVLTFLDEGERMKVNAVVQAVLKSLTDKET